MNTVRVLIYLRKNPGSTCTQIARALAERAPLVSLALQELRAAARVTSAGNTKATKWNAI